MNTVRCPYCLKVVVAPEAPRPVAPPSRPEAPNRSWWRGTQAPPPPPAPAPAAERAGADRTGPCPHCKRTLPQDWRAAGTTCIVTAGARETGKSIYIAVMIKQLQQFGASVGMEVRPASKAVASVFEEKYLQPLYEQRGVMQATPPIRSADTYVQEPLVFELITRSGYRHHLVVRDVAGEDLETPEMLQDGELDFFADADCVFFLYDPLKIPSIKNRLRELVPEQREGADPMPVFNTTLDLVRGAGPRLAVIMSKFDAMQALRTAGHGDDWTAIMHNEGAGFCRDPGPLSPSDHDGELVHEEVRSLLLLLGASPLAYKAERVGGGRPDGYRFFAVSALGNPPNGEVLSSRGIAPFRVLDPLRWALRGTGVMA